MACQNLKTCLLSQENAWWKSMAASIRWCLNTQRRWYGDHVAPVEMDCNKVNLWYTSYYQIGHLTWTVFKEKPTMYSQDCLKSLQYNLVLCHPQKSLSPTRVNFQLRPATLPRHDWDALSIGPRLSLLSNGLSKKQTLQLIYRWFRNIEPARQIIFWVNPPKFSLNKIIWATMRKCLSATCHELLIGWWFAVSPHSSSSQCNQVVT